MYLQLRLFWPTASRNACSIQACGYSSSASFSSSAIIGLSMPMFSSYMPKMLGRSIAPAGGPSPGGPCSNESSVALPGSAFRSDSVLSKYMRSRTPPRSVSLDRKTPRSTPLDSALRIFAAGPSSPSPTALMRTRSDNSSLSVMDLGNPRFWWSSHSSLNVHFSSARSSICSNSGPKTGLGTGVVPYLVREACEPHLYANSRDPAGTCRLSNRTTSLRKYSGTVPVGPLRCLDTISSAMFLG